MAVAQGADAGRRRYRRRRHRRPPSTLDEVFLHLTDRTEGAVFAADVPPLPELDA